MNFILFGSPLCVLSSGINLNVARLCAFSIYSFSFHSIS
nr:MAG TPA: hypothetical protein [Caudoviricetes sp.]